MVIADVPATTADVMQCRCVDPMVSSAAGTLVERHNV
jgi:hypothetical protein